MKKLTEVEKLAKKLEGLPPGVQRKILAPVIKQAMSGYGKEVKANENS